MISAVMSNMFKYIFVLCIFTANSVYAFQPKSTKNCENRETTATELSQCLDIVKAYSDKQMQTWINNQTFILKEFVKISGRRSALTMFKRSQRNFITYRENNCRWQYLHISPGKNAASAYKKCYIQITNNRILELSKLN